MTALLYVDEKFHEISTVADSDTQVSGIRDALSAAVTAFLALDCDGMSFIVIFQILFLYIFYYVFSALFSCFGCETI